LKVKNNDDDFNNNQKTSSNLEDSSKLNESYNEEQLKVYDKKISEKSISSSNKLSKPGTKVLDTDITLSDYSN